MEERKGMEGESHMGEWSGGIVMCRGKERGEEAGRDSRDGEVWDRWRGLIGACGAKLKKSKSIALEMTADAPAGAPMLARGRLSSVSVSAYVPPSCTQGEAIQSSEGGRRRGGEEVRR